MEIPSLDADRAIKPLTEARRALLRVRETTGHIFDAAQRGVLGDRERELGTHYEGPAVVVFGSIINKHPYSMRLSDTSHQQPAYGYLPPPIAVDATDESGRYITLFTLTPTLVTDPWGRPVTSPEALAAIQTMITAYGDAADEIRGGTTPGGDQLPPASPRA